MKAFIILLTVFLVSANARCEPELLDLSKYSGKVVYLDFWASWCEPCKESFPWLNQLKKKFPDLVLIGINVDKDKALADTFLKKYPANFEIIYDPTASMAKKYNVAGMPYTILFDSKGEVRVRQIGFSKEIAANHLKELALLSKESK